MMMLFPHVGIVRGMLLLQLLLLSVKSSIGFAPPTTTGMRIKSTYTDACTSLLPRSRFFDVMVGTRLFLYVDSSSMGTNGGNGGGECYSLETIESIKSNEWGIPSSTTLPPYSSVPRAELDNGGKVTLVGSGPGDPDLLTLKAHRLLQDPDALVIADRLVSQEILDLIRGEVKVARKLPGCAELAQEEIYWWTHQGLGEGRHVVRLKIGDPFVFGRGGEEVIQFRKFGVESTVIPVRSIVVVAFAGP
jgi:Tetrapyrrole (Corrin/Porphyrin) Methylases